MSQKTGIQWTNATWNPVTGCTKVSAGCEHCYADRLTTRFGRGPFTQIRLHSHRLSDPMHWHGSQMVFTCSMGDLFHENIPWDFILKVFGIMAATPRHTYQVLTKRPKRMMEFAKDVLVSEGRLWPANVWAGTSVENTKCLGRIDFLQNIPANVRFVSAEPLLERLDLSSWLGSGILNWVIVGGESGQGARSADLEWIRFLISQCRNSNIPVFVKQLGTAWALIQSRKSTGTDYKGGSTSAWPADLRVREYPPVPVLSTED